MEAQNLTRPTLLGEEESPPQILGLVVVSPQYYISCWSISPATTEINYGC